MKNLVTVGLAAVFAAGFVNAQSGIVMVEQVDVVSSDEPEATVDAALVSADVWRGQVRNEDIVFQPQFTIAQYGVSFNVWANYDFSENYAGVNNDIGEIDLSLAYTLPIDLNDVSFDIGVINYQFPANGSNASIPTPSGVGINSESTTELFAAAHWLTFRDYILPSVTLFGDVKEVDGIYVLFDFVVPYQISEYLYVEAGASTGYGDQHYNAFYFPSANAEKGFNDYNFFGTVYYELLDGVTASLNLTYTGLYGGQIKDSAKRVYEGGEKFWGGVNISYDF
ncbi:hypothetical protein P4C99_17905 [Pontiellaceae bacterium B1224]|nr:hypothetical protein [Pontiellaceae bacterium B1224]